jgi:hypothetical protein
MKQLATSYSFNASSKTVTLTGLNVPLNYVLLIVNATRNAIIYNLADAATGAQSYAQGASSVITLKVDLSGMSNTDKLTIFYDDGKESALIAVQGPKGEDGAAGTDGDDGAEVQLQKSATHIQWRYVGDLTWTDLVALNDLKGADGNAGAAGVDGNDGADAVWNFTGAYNLGLPYAVGDVATYDGETWYRKNSNGGNVGDTPSEGTFWTKLAQKGAGEITHASNHATGGTDQLMPADIGAVSGFEVNGTPNTNIAPAAVELRDIGDPSALALQHDSRSYPQYNPWSVNSSNQFREAIGAATADQGAKADSALQSADLTPYRTSAAQDTIDAGKASTAHTHALSDLTVSGATNFQVPSWNGTAWVPQTIQGVQIEVTEAEYAALSPAQVDQTATYIVNSTANQNATTYQGKEFGGLKPVTLLAHPVVIGSANRVSPTISIGSIDWIQVSPVDPAKFYFSQNIGGGAKAALWRGTLTRDSANRISGGTNSYGGQQAAEFDIYNGTKGGGIYDANTVFIPDERNLSIYPNNGRILKVDLVTGTTSEAWNFSINSTPEVFRADIASQVWYPDDCMVDRANNKLFIGSGSPSTNTNGSSVARFSIDPTTKTLTPDSWVKAVTANGSGINFIRRLTLLPDGYIFVANHNLSTNTASFQTFDAYGSASENGVSVGISYASGNIVQAAAFKADTNAPSGIGYILIAPRNGSEKGKIYAYDYQGEGAVNTTATNSTDLTTIGKNAGLYTNSLTLEIGAIAVTPDGAILVGLRSGTTTPIPRSVIAFNWIPYAKSGTLSTQNLDNVSITGGSINGVRNLTPKVEYINASRSWWKDEAAKFIRVQAWSGGGGGGSGRKDSTGTIVRSGGGGGGGGGYIDVMLDASIIVTTTVPVTITIGGGGAGGAAQSTNATNGNIGTQGGNTSFAPSSTNTILVLGGNAGAGGSLTGALGGTGSLNGNAGASAAADGGALSGSPGSIIAPVGVGGTGGGSGGGLNASNAMFAGGVGGVSFYGVLGTAAAGGTTNGGNGAAGNNTATGIYQVGGGGGGGGAHTTGNGGTGGVGGFGSGGGGGGASQNGNSGAGGVGGNGFMIVTTYY